MPPDGYTVVTITEQTAAKLAELTTHSDELGGMSDGVEHAIDLALADRETITNADLARLLHERLFNE